MVAARGSTGVAPSTKSQDRSALAFKHHFANTGPAYCVRASVSLRPAEGWDPGTHGGWRVAKIRVYRSAMPGDPELCRQNAARCAQLASGVSDPQLKEA